MAKIIGNTTATPNPIGNLSNLETKNKNSLVDAINEAAKSGSSSGGIYTGSDEPSDNVNIWIDTSEDYPQNTTGLHVADDGDGNITFDTKIAGTEVVLADDGNGNIEIGVI